MRLIALLMAFSLSGCATFCFVGCHDDVPRPDSNACEYIVGMDVPGQPDVFEMHCHNLKTDYDSNGNLLKNSKGVKVPPVITKYPDAASMLKALNRSIGFDPLSLAHLKAYIRNLRAAN